MEILYNNRQEEIEITNNYKESIRVAISMCLQMENVNDNVEISISFVTNNEIKELNRTYRNVDKETDVLSFPMDDEEEEDGTIILGDIVISSEKIIEQAKEYGHSIEREMIYLVVHSMFHLLGYDHIKENKKDVMRGKEKEVMKKIKLFK